MSSKSANIDDEEDDSSLPPGKKTGRKKHYPFGTPSHMRHPYSFFAHLNQDNKAFAIDLATATDIEPEVIVVKPKRARRPKANYLSSGSGANGEDADGAVDPMDIIPPTTEGLEPCTRIACQQVIRSILDVQYKNEIEREEIEDEYQRLLQELETAEGDIASAESKLVNLSEVGNQLEQRYNQLQSNVDTLESTREQLHSERSDINNKMMVTETERQKCNRKLEKAEKALTEAMWHKKNKEYQDNVEAGISLGGSIISELPIKHSDASTIASADATYRTAYSRLAKTQVVDVIEQPPAVFTLPHYLTQRLETMPHHFDKYSKRHYKQLAQHGVESWNGMEGSCLTAAVGSSATKGPDQEHVAASYHEYTSKLATKKNLEADIATELGRAGSSSNNSVAASRVSSLLQSRNSQQGGGSLSLSKSLGSLSLSQQMKGSSIGSAKSRRTRSQQQQQSKSNVRLDPLNTTATGTPTRFSSSRGSGNGNNDNNNSSIDAGDSFDSLPGFAGAQQSVVSALSAAGASAAMAQDYIDDPSHRLDPVFYSDKARAQWGRKTKVGKVRTTDIVWGMASYSNSSSLPPQHQPKSKLQEQQQRRQSTQASNSGGGGRLKSEKASSPTVKSRSLTMYHPNMDVFQDSFKLNQ